MRLWMLEGRLPRGRDKAKPSMYVRRGDFNCNSFLCKEFPYRVWGRFVCTAVTNHPQYLSVGTQNRLQPSQATPEIVDRHVAPTSMDYAAAPLEQEHQGVLVLEFSRKEREAAGVLAVVGQWC